MDGAFVSNVWHNVSSDLSRGTVADLCRNTVVHEVDRLVFSAVSYTNPPCVGWDAGLEVAL